MSRSSLVAGLVLAGLGLTAGRARALEPVPFEAVVLDAEIICVVDITRVGDDHIDARAVECVDPARVGRTLRFRRQDRLGYGLDHRPWPYRPGQRLLVFLHEVDGELALTGGSFNEGELFVQGEEVFSQWNRIGERHRPHRVWGESVRLSRAGLDALLAIVREAIDRRPDRDRRGEVRRWSDALRRRLRAAALANDR